MGRRGVGIGNSWNLNLRPLFRDIGSDPRRRLRRPRDVSGAAVAHVVTLLQCKPNNGKQRTWRIHTRQFRRFERTDDKIISGPVVAELVDAPVCIAIQESWVPIQTGGREAVRVRFPATGPSLYSLPAFLPALFSIGGFGPGLIFSRSPTASWRLRVCRLNA